jgi:FXSXX-COOH protein
MSEKVPPSPETNDSPRLLNVSAESLEELLNNSDDVLSNSVRRVTEEAANEEKYAAFGNAP